MSTKSQTSSTNNMTYDPTSLNNYQGLQAGITGTLNNFMSNPLTNSQFQSRVNMGNQQISQMQGANMNALMQNFKNQGFTGAAPTAYMQSQIGNMSRGTSAMKSNNFLSQLQNANNMQLQATGMAQSYQPLLTGTTGQSTTQTSGLGTWLPQLAGGLLGAGMGALTGGMSGGGSALNMLGMSPSPTGGAMPTNAAGVMGTLPSGSYGGGGMNPLIMGSMTPTLPNFTGGSGGGYYGGS